MNEEKKLENSLQDAEDILENILCRKNWTPAVRDRLADKLRRIVVERGGYYASKLKTGGR